jgi:hypothetical protein
MNEFEDLKKTWDAQNDEPIYAINEQALFKRITAKKDQTLTIANTSEWLLIFVNMVAGGFILGSNFPNDTATTWMHVMAVWMLGVASYLIAMRIRRVQESKKFDRTVQGDLAHAISVAGYQVRLSQLMQWNIVPIGILIAFGLWTGGKSIWVGIATAAFFVLAFYLGRWEHGIYLSRKRELETLKQKLESEDQ